MCVGLGALFLRVIRWSRYLSCTHVHFCPSRTHLTVRVPFCGVILRPPYTPSLYAFLLLEFVVELCSARSQSRFSMCHLGLSALSSAFAGQPFSPPPQSRTIWAAPRRPWVAMDPKLGSLVLSFFEPFVDHHQRDRISLLIQMFRKRLAVVSDKPKATHSHTKNARQLRI